MAQMMRLALFGPIFIVSALSVAYSINNNLNE